MKTSKISMKHSLSTVLFFIFVIFSCRQQSDFVAANNDEVYIKKAKEWTELSGGKLRKSDGKEPETWIKDWDKAEVIVDRNGEKTVVVPSRNIYLVSVNDQIEYNTYFLVKFDKGESIIGSEILHVINEKYSIKKTVGELFQGRNDIMLGDFSGCILKQRGDGTGWVVGNRFERGKRVGVTILNSKNIAHLNNQEKKSRVASQCWDVYYESYVNGELVYERYLGIYCEEDTAPGDGDIGGGGPGGNGPSNEIISSTLTDPCYKGVLEDLLTNSYNMHAVLQDILPNFNSNENLILNITQEAFGPSGEDGSYLPMGMVGGAKKYQITLNDAALSGAGQEYIAVTILHEVLHAHFDAAGVNLDHHSNMANLYVGPMAQSLVSLYGMPIDIATAMAWGGLHGTAAWNNLSTSDRNFYQYANNLWRNSGNPRATAPGTKCN